MPSARYVARARIIRESSADEFVAEVERALTDHPDAEVRFTLSGAEHAALVTWFEPRRPE